VVAVAVTMALAELVELVAVEMVELLHQMKAVKVEL
jgi:hypothetical protein